MYEKLIPFHTHQIYTFLCCNKQKQQLPFCGCTKEEEHHVHFLVSHFPSHARPTLKSFFYHCLLSTIVDKQKEIATEYVTYSLFMDALDDDDDDDDDYSDVLDDEMVHVLIIT
jgi:hypothetical protein